MSLSSSRKAILSVLKKNLNDNNQATNFEKEIYKMCQRLSKDEFEGESVEDIYNKYAFEKIGDSKYKIAMNFVNYCC